MLAMCISEYPQVEDTDYSSRIDSQFLYRVATNEPNEYEVSVPVFPLGIHLCEGIPQTSLICNCILTSGYPGVKDN